MNYTQTLQNAGYKRGCTCNGTGNRYTKGKIKFTINSVNKELRFMKYESGKEVATGAVNEIENYI